VWPTQIADALRGPIHQANLAREQGLPAIAADIRDALLTRPWMPALPAPT
jgi:transposase